MPPALLVIDVQRGLMEEGPWEAGRLLARIAELLGKARAAGAPVLFIQDTRVRPFDLDPSLAPRPGEPVLAKDFCDAFLDTPLRAELERRGVGRLVVCGLQTDYCIDTTCRRAASLGYRVDLAADAHSTFDHAGLAAEAIVAHHNHILRAFKAGSGSVRTAPAGAIRFDPEPAG